MKTTPIRRSAKGQDCTARIYGCTPGPDNETVVFCHAPFHGKSGTRFADNWGAYCCYTCHAVLDGRVPWGVGGESPTEVWYHAIHETQKILIAKGLIIIGGKG